MNYKNFLRLLAAASLVLATVRPALAQNWAYHAVLPVKNQITNANGTFWYLNSVACSADGTTVVASANGGLVCVSTDLGATWQATPLPTNGWTGVACSADGTKMVAVAETYTVNDSYMTLYTSSDTGATWTPQSVAPYAGVGNFDEWWSVASSADGIKLAAGVEELDTNQNTSPLLFGGIALSSDSGATWQPTSLTGIWTAVASSANGSTLVALGRFGFPATNQQAVYLSTDAGGSWQQADLPQQFLNFITVSGDGSTMIATGTNVFISRNSGATWQEWTNAPQGPSGSIFFTAPASSADGTKLMVGAFGGGSPGTIYTSDDSGVTWASTNNAIPGAGGFLFASASSEDGRDLIAIPRNEIYVFTLDFPQPGHVYCSCNSNGIAGATVQIGTNSVTCDSNGVYSVTNMAPGNYTATINASNYYTLTTSLTVYPNQPVTNNFYLTNATFLIDPVLDASITSLDNVDAVSNSIIEATQSYTNLIANPICVRILFYATNEGLGASLPARAFMPYSQYWADLEANTNMSANDIAALATLHPPPNTGVLTNTTMVLTAALVDAIGEHALSQATIATNGGLDSEIWLNISLMNVTRPDTVANNYDLQTVAKHEIDETLGIGGPGCSLGYPGTNFAGSMDLYRYASAGFRSFNYSTNNSPYFSIDDGSSNLVYFNQNPNGDYGDWGNGSNRQIGNNPGQVQDAFATPGAAIDLGVKELVALDVVGYTLLGTTTIQGGALSSNAFTFTVNTLPGQTYQVQYRASLTQGTWQNLNGPFVATGLTQAISDTTAEDTNQRYYRVVGIPPASRQPAIARSRPPAIVPTPEMIVTNGAKHYFRPRGPQISK
jgi:hypothetical protein